MTTKAELRRTMGAYRRSKRLSPAQMAQRREAALISAARRRGRALTPNVRGNRRMGHIYVATSRHSSTATSRSSRTRAAVPSRKRHGRYWWPAGQF